MRGWLRPVQTRLVSPEYAWRVVPPAYDLLTPYERYRWASKNPDSFFNAFTPSDSWPNKSFSQLVSQAAGYLDRQLRRGVFGPMVEGLFVYRITDSVHQQTGVVGDAPVAAAPRTLVPHETTRTDREKELYEYMGEVPYSSNPMGLGYPPREEINCIVEEICRGCPRCLGDAGKRRSAPDLGGSPGCGRRVVGRVLQGSQGVHRRWSPSGGRFPSTRFPLRRR